ncbi:hypothetical protein KIW84_070770 [Lathyrus oleraceus]|uniref:Uncharacterized protein n=1 Tax=Pisum sativum TaxID=3888 RepID=A0A9D4VID2_PEA|nr:hypothetical protein KIW84_070770 [Pisum sativum]
MFLHPFSYASRDFGWQQRYARFCGRVAVLSILGLLLYPFLWAWTIVGTMWFRSAKSYLPEEGQKWGFLIWLLFSYCGLLCIACMSVGKKKHVEEDDVLPLATVLIHRPRFSVAACVRIGLDSDWFMRFAMLASDWLSSFDRALTATA